MNHRPPYRLSSPTLRKLNGLFIVWLFLVGSAFLGGSEGCAPAPSDGLIVSRPARLVLEASIDRWDEAIPLGNGLTGGLLWGEGDTIRLSLDRGDLWDERLSETLQRKDWTYQTLQRLVAKRDQKTIEALFDTSYNRVPYPTKLPGGRLEIILASDQHAQSFALDPYTATASVDLGGDSVQVFFSAREPMR